VSKIEELALIFRRVRQHLLAIGISANQSRRIASLVERWYHESGPEWTVKRLKALNESMVESLISGEHYKVPLGWKTRKNRKGRVIFNDYLIHTVFMQAESNLKLARSFLKMYELIQLKHLSDSQRDKMDKAITSPPTVPLENLLERIQTFRVRPTTRRERLRLTEIGLTSRTLVDYIGETKSGPCFLASGKNWLYQYSKTRQEVDCFRFEEYYTHDSQLNQLWKEFPTEVSYRLLGVNNYPYIDVDEERTTFPAGTIATLQEVGCKVRWIANPILSIQVLGDPLKDKLFAYTKRRYPEIRTADQDSGRSDVHQWLCEGRTVYSYDCTSFTDRFPLVLQEVILEQLHQEGVANPFDMAAFKLVMKKNWYFPQEKRTLQWSVGQPLGYGPSFHLATVSHAVILDSLDLERTRLWRVVGDDVVIADSSLALAYQEFMTKLCGVEINHAKSVISADYAEFLGKFISKKKGIIPSIKIKLLDKTDRVVRTMAFYGPRAYQYLDSTQQGMALKCYLPSYVGGLGLIPLGMSYSCYIEQLNTDLLQKRSMLESVEDFHRNIPHGVDSKVGDFVALKNSILEANTKVLDLLGIAEIQQHLGQDVRLNEMTRLPTTILVEDKPHDALLKASNSWTYIQDRAWLLNCSPSLSLGQTIKSYTFNTLSHTYRPLLNRWGYVDRAEKPSTLSRTETSSLPVILDRKSKNDSQYQNHHKSFYRKPREFQKELSKAKYEANFGPEEACKGD